MIDSPPFAFAGDQARHDAQAPLHLMGSGDQRLTDQLVEGTASL